MDDRNRPEPRREGGLSTADLATAAEQRQPRPGERAQELPRDERYPGEPLGTRVERPEPMQREPRQEQPERPVALLSDQDTQGFRARWEAVQAGFVDSPRDAVQEADGLVAELMKRLAESFAGARSDLDQQWSRGENVSTEDLRLALRRYRSFFDRLLSI
jgi:hypothetical protein